MNYSLLKILIKKIEREKLPINPSNIKTFEGLTDYELKKILLLKSKQFRGFIKTIFILNEKLDISVYKDVLQSITKLLLNNLDKPSYSHLVQLLRKTSIINSSEILEFSRLFLTIKDKNKINTIKEVLLIKNDMNLISFLETIMLVKNSLQLEIIKEIFIKKEQIYPYKFNDLVSLILNSSRDVLDCINDCLKSNFLLKNSQLIVYLNYLKKCDNVNKMLVVTAIISNQDMIRSNCLKKVLNTVVKLKNDFYLPYIEYLAENKKYMNDMFFDKILTIVFMFHKKYQIESFFSLLNNKEIIEDNYKLDLVVKYLKRASKVQTLYILKLVTQFNYLDNPRIIPILDILVNSNSATRLNSIVELVKYIIDSENFFEIIRVINEVKNNLTFSYLRKIIEIKPNIVDLELDLIKSFISLEYGFQLEFALYLIRLNLLNRNNILNGNKLVNIIQFIKNINVNQVKLVNTIILNTDIINRYDVIEYLNLVIDINEDYKIKVLNNILLNNPNISKERFSLLVNLIKKFNRNELRFVLGEVLDEVTPDGEKLVVNSKKRLKKNKVHF